ncbi:hypothetical protein FXO38_03037, partial [Capsicum annuum]
IFRTSLVSHPVVVSIDPEVNNYYVFQQEEVLLQCWYLRNLVLNLIGSHKLKNNHISEIDLNIRKRWAVQDEMLITFMAKKMLGCDEQKALEFRKHYKAFMDGFVCFPIYLLSCLFTEYKSTTFAHKVVNEIVRLSNIVPGIFRKVVNDVKIEGFTIPAGWIVLVCPPSVHLDSNNYEDPHVFNPWRWKASVFNLDSHLIFFSCTNNIIEWTCGNPQVHPTSSWRLVGVSDYVLELISPSCKYHFFSPLLGH